MSRIYFHFKNDEIEVSGSERAHMGIIIGDIFVGIADPDKDWLNKVIPKDHYLHSCCSSYEDAARTWLRVGEHFEVNGKKIDLFTCQLNTALVVGGDIIKLMARLHGQCEIFCYCLPKNFKWIKNIVALGLEKHIFRPNSGWEELIIKLGEEKKSPFVCSYSVSNRFPCAYYAGFTSNDENDEPCKIIGSKIERWENLSHEEQWNKHFSVLRNSLGFLELKPDNWNTYFFSEGITIFDIKNYTSLK